MSYLPLHFLYESFTELWLHLLTFQSPERVGRTGKILAEDFQVRTKSVPVVLTIIQSRCVLYFNKYYPNNKDQYIGQAVSNRRRENYIAIKVNLVPGAETGRALGARLELIKVIYYDESNIFRLTLFNRLKIAGRISSDFKWSVDTAQKVKLTQDTWLGKNHTNNR